ncbi:MAG TPA: hypothetical protein VJ023_06540 [Pyrinomonadaceae bacterium]|nr:hypothetical protein [Pyrinomonadaceae bacterium]
MKCKRFKILLLTVLLAGSYNVFAQKTLSPDPKRPRAADDYKPRTLKEVIDAPDTDSRGNKLETMLIYADIFPSRAGVTFTGSSRPLLQLKKEVLRQWARLYAGVPEGYTDRYETEMLFTQNGNDYWLAIRKDLLPHFKQVLRAGDAVDLNLIRVGSAKLSEAWEPVLLVESRVSSTAQSCAP